MDIRTVNAPVRMASPAECLRWCQEISGTLQQMLQPLDGDVRRRVWEEIATALGTYEGPRGFESPCELLVGAGRKAF